MKRKILSLLACICICAGVQTAQAQDYGIDIFGFSGKAYAKSASEKSIYVSSQEKVLYLNCENEGFSFFVYDKKSKFRNAETQVLDSKGELLEADIMLITDTLPKIEATTKSKGKITLTKVANEITIIPDALGKFTFTVITTAKGKKIMQDFVFEVIATPPVILICVDENGKYLDGTPLDVKNMPNKMKLIVISTGEDKFSSQCPNQAKTKVEYRVTLARGSQPLGNVSSTENGIANLTSLKGKTTGGDVLVLNKIEVTRIIHNGEKVIANCRTKFMVFSTK